MKKKQRKGIISRSFLIQVYTLRCLLASTACLVPGSDYVVLNSTAEEQKEEEAGKGEYTFYA